MPEPRPLPPWLELIPASSAAQSQPETTASTEPSQTDNVLPWDTMSSSSTPISAAAFSVAIHDLPIDALYAKAAELLNSMQHLRDSNDQMQEFADDEVCREAIAENGVVMARIRERVNLCKAEVEGRGLRWTGQFWHADGRGGESETKVNGVARPADESMEGDGDDGVHL